MSVKRLKLALAVVLAYAAIGTVQAFAEAPTTLYYDDFSNYKLAFDAASTEQQKNLTPTQHGWSGRVGESSMISRVNEQSAMDTDANGVLLMAPTGEGTKHMGLDIKVHNFLTNSKQIDFTRTGDTLALEMKFKTSKLGGHKFFSFRDKANVVSPAMMEMNDEGEFVFKDKEQGDVVLGTYTPNAWTHLMLLLEVTDGSEKVVSADVYIDGEKRNEAPLQLNTGASNGWSVFIRYETDMAYPDTVYIDDAIARTFGDLYLEKSSVSHGDGALAFYLDFNMIPDADSLENIVVYKEDTPIAGTIVSAMAEDATWAKVEIPFGEGESVAGITVDYTGVKDILGNTAEGILVPTAPTLVSSQPETGAVEVRRDTTVSMTFSKALSAAAFDPEAISITDIQEFDATLSADGRTINIQFPYELMAGKEYTVNLPERFVDEEGFPIERDSASISFTTVKAPDKLTVDIGSAVAGSGYVVEKTNLGGTNVINGFMCGNFVSENTTDQIITDGGMVFNVDEGINSFELYWFDGGRANAVMTFSVSPDGVTYTDVEVTEFMDNSIQHPEWKRGAVVYTNTSLPEGTKYVKVWLKKTGDTAWGTVLHKMNLNCTIPEPAAIEASTPENGGFRQPLTDTITIAFSNSMYAGGLDGDSISINDGTVAVKRVQLGEKNELVVTLEEPLKPLTSYTVSFAPSVMDIYGQQPAANQMVFKTRPQIELESAALTAGTSLPVSGTAVPTFTLKNAAANGAAVMMACLYNGKELVDVSYMEVSGLAAGTHPYTLDALEIPGAGCTLKLYVLDSVTGFRPVSDVVTITNAGTVIE